MAAFLKWKIDQQPELFLNFAGFPRTVVQAEKLSEKQELDIVINLDVPFETIIDRISVSLLQLSYKQGLE